MTNEFTAGRSLFGRLADRWTRRGPPRPRQAHPLDELNDHYLRDIGLRRERSPAVRLHQLWM
ncbi:MAG: hypothetical protein K5872_05990 [Rhizobiaceae bacterium]|nr:hypothetical protein [Rhizobiaceae bacterium]MCV0405763.1 hypothetical protein [Rhizobiaceae bacterium]